MKNLHSEHPGPTYRGYRRQILYSLYRLLQELPGDVVIQPESREDLTVFSTIGEVVDIIQVKDFSSPLVFSSFKKAFYKRIVQYSINNPRTSVTIVHYGELGNDFLKIKESDKDTINKFIKYVTAIKECNISRNQAVSVLDNLQFQKVDEVILTNKILDILRVQAAGIDLQAAIDLLMNWVYMASEKQVCLTRENVLKKLNNIGRFLAERKAFYDQWHTSIIPLEFQDISTDCLEQLSEEFHRGISARFEHIQCGLDIDRPSLMTKIAAGFRENNIVILRGASGQGKSTLGYRYCADTFSEGLRFKVEAITDAKQARKIALALSGYAEALELPVVVFLDVRPGNMEWIEVIRGLCNVPHIRILVAIREEDWYRCHLSPAELNFIDIEMHLGEDEAEELYGNLGQVINGQFIDFQDVWSKFGEKGPLLEFVYLLNKTELLEDRLREQIRTIQKEICKNERDASELEFLTHVAVGTAYDTQLDLQLLLNICPVPNPQSMLEFFEKEYLFRVSDDGRYLEGLHAVRSKILAKILIDPVIKPYNHFASNCLACINEDMLEMYLLCLFSRHPKEQKFLLEMLQKFTPKTWVGICGVVRALLWLGIRDYAFVNKQVIDDTKEAFNGAWMIPLEFDVGLADCNEDSSCFEKMIAIDPNFRKRAQPFREHQTPITDAHKPLIHWLNETRQVPAIRDIEQDYLAKAEVLYWIGHLKISINWQPFESSEMFKALNIVSSGRLADFYRGVREGCPVQYKEWIDINESYMREEIQSKAGIIKFENTNDSLVGHFIIQREHDKTIMKGSQSLCPKKVDVLNFSAVQRCQLFCAVFPGKKKYGSFGYGQNTLLLQFPNDNTHKDMTEKYLLPPWSAALNSNLLGLVEFSERPETWESFFFSIAEVRRLVLLCLLDLYASIQKWRKEGKPQNLCQIIDIAKWELCLKKLNRTVRLPQVAVDEWGFVSETKSEEKSEINQENRGVAILRYRKLMESQREWFRTLTNFFNQSPDAMVMCPPLYAAKSAIQRTHIFEILEKEKVTSNSVRLSLVNFRDACKAILEFQQELNETLYVKWQEQELCDQEIDVYRKVLSCWHDFISILDKKPTTLNKNSKKKSDRKNKNRIIRRGDALSQTHESLRMRIRADLKALSIKGINAAILTESVCWDGQPALWITIDVSHPFDLLHIPDLAWKVLQNTGISISKPYHADVLAIYWQKIIILPTVLGRSIRRHAYFNFHTAICYDDSLENHLYVAFPEEITEKIWLQLGIDTWPISNQLVHADELFMHYEVLINRVSYIADFFRIPGELDEVSQNLLQIHINREMQEGLPILQQTLDLAGEFLKHITLASEGSSEESNVVQALICFTEAFKSILPSPEFDGEITLSLGEMVKWRDQLYGARQNLYSGYLLWMAHCYGFPAYNWEKSQIMMV